MTVDEAASYLGITPNELRGYMELTPEFMRRAWASDVRGDEARHAFYHPAIDRWFREFCYWYRQMDSKPAVLVPEPPVEVWRRCRKWFRLSRSEEARLERKGMPTPRTIQRWWQDDLGVEEGVSKCFACSKVASLDRAHILAIQHGGKNGADNLHLLCKRCHLASERLTGDEYWAWFNAKRAAR